jgi:Protein of unknown function (DUF669)
MFFSSRDVPLSKSYKELVPGVYHLLIKKLDLKYNKTSSGSYLEVEFSVIKPEEFEGAEFVHRFTMNNESPKAMEYGRRLFSDLLFTIQAPSELATLEQTQSATIGKEFLAEIGIEIEEGQNGNEYNKPKIMVCWSLGGKHRNPELALKEIKIGANGRKPYRSKNTRAEAPKQTYTSDAPF